VTSLLSRITFDPEQCGGRPCIRGFRLRVKDVLDMLASGMSEAQILDEYDFLEPEDIKAALTYAAQQVDHAVLVPAE
jgi:uncharacterized protein (DUF433 family)